MKIPPEVIFLIFQISLPDRTHITQTLKTDISFLHFVSCLFQLVSLQSQLLSLNYCNNNLITLEWCNHCFIKMFGYYQSLNLSDQLNPQTLLHCPINYSFISICTSHLLLTQVCPITHAALLSLMVTHKYSRG